MATTKLQLRVSLLSRSFHLLNSLSFQKKSTDFGKLETYIQNFDGSIPSTFQWDAKRKLYVTSPWEIYCLRTFTVRIYWNYVLLWSPLPLVSTWFLVHSPSPPLSISPALLQCKTEATKRTKKSLSKLELNVGPQNSIFTAYCITVSKPLPLQSNLALSTELIT